MSESATFLQPDDALPVVEKVPAPWALDGNAWVVVLRWPNASEVKARTAFVPASLRPTVGGALGFLLCVDYVRAPCGPYRELLLIPGSMLFADGRRHLSISRIVVSTWASVVNGRANWGIPKDRADFTIEDGKTTRIIVTDRNREICGLEFATPRGPRLPVNSAWLPGRYRTLAQRHAGRTYYYAPAARGVVCASRLLDWQFEAALFPDLRAASVLAALRIERFAMTFPAALVS